MTSGGSANPITGNNNGTMQPASTGVKPVVNNQTSCSTNTLELCCQAAFSCGMQYPPVSNAPLPSPSQGQTPYGAFPWQVALLTNDLSYIAGGVLINHQTILTTAHKVANVA